LPNVPLAKGIAMRARILRKNLSADNLIRLVRTEFQQVPDKRSEPQVVLADALMSGYAVFALEYPSLLAFEEYSSANAFNLTSLFGIQRVPSDTQMRVLLDPIDPGSTARAASKRKAAAAR
jgi:hypothetical protein